MRRAPFFVLAIALFASCAGGEKVAGDRRVVDNVVVTFTVTPSEVEVGRTVRFVLRLTNNGGRAETLTFSSGQQYDFWVTAADADAADVDDGAREVWRWSTDRVFTQAIVEKTIDPQGSLTLTESWTPEEGGSFIAHGALRAERYERDLTGRLSVGE